MQRIDNQRIMFKDNDQMRRYEILSQRTNSPTRYPDFQCLETLGQRDSLNYMFNQISRDKFSVDRQDT